MSRRGRQNSSVPFRQRAMCTVGEAAEQGFAGKTKLHEWIKSGRIKSIKYGDGKRGRRLIDVPSLLAVLDGTEPEVRHG